MKTINYLVFSTTALLLLLGLPGASVAKGGAKGDTAWTMWAVVFNNPSECITDDGDGGSTCGETDVFGPDFPDEFAPNEAAGVAVIYMTGQRVQKKSHASFAATLAVGASMGALGGFPENTLIDADAAEVHLILRLHGRVLRDLLTEQVSSLNGGCPPNTCEDIQFAEHKPDYADAAGVSEVDVHWFSNGSSVKKATSRLTRSAGGVTAVVNTRFK